jgi:DNA invertase Pin-like site-specific DNA recombinase
MTTQQHGARPVRALALTRLSSDPKGRRIDHETQVRSITEVVRREGWPQIAAGDWFQETDRSASDPTVERHAMKALIATLSAIDRHTTKPIIVVGSQDRLNRSPDGSLVRLANLLQQKDGELWSASQGPIGITKGGRTVLLIQDAIAIDESEKVSKRTGDGTLTAAINGKPHGQLGYGWRRIYDSEDRKLWRDELHPEQSETVHEVAVRVLAGESLRSIVRDLNARGVPTPGKGDVVRRDPVTREPLQYADDEWSSIKLRQILTRKTNIGIRVHRPVAADPSDTPEEYAGTWPPLLDRGLYAQLMLVLTSPDRRTSRGNRATTLLSGIAQCYCGELATSARRRDPYGATRTIYRCKFSHVGKAAPRVDALVVETALDMLSRDEVQRVVRGNVGSKDRKAAERCAQIDAELIQLELDRTSGVVGRAEWLRMKTAWQAEREKLQRVQRRDSLVFRELALADDKETAWKSLPLDRQRAIVNALVTVTLKSSPRRGKYAFDPNTVDIDLRVFE